MIAEAPCFIDVVAPVARGMPPALAQISHSGSTKMAPAATSSSWGQTLSALSYGLSGTLAGMAVLARASRRSARRHKRTQMFVAGTVSVNEYVLQSESSVAVPVGPKGTSPDATVEAYVKRPVKEFTFVPIAYGASLNYKGLAKTPTGTEENQFEVTVPTLDFGAFKIEPVATSFLKHGPSCLVIEGEKVELRGAPEEMAAAVESALFKLKLEFGYNDTPDKHELTLKGNIHLAMNGEGAPMPKDMFESVGNGVMGIAFSTLLDGLARSFADDYMKWSQDAAFRSERAQKAA